jgi:hypothetical protein
VTVPSTGTVIRAASGALSISGGRKMHPFSSATFRVV